MSIKQDIEILKVLASGLLANTQPLEEYWHGIETGDNVYDLNVYERNGRIRVDAYEVTDDGDVDTTTLTHIASRPLTKVEKKLLKGVSQ
jgi:hypothetical protein